MATNITNISNIGNIYDMAYYANASTGGIFWGIILVSIFIIVLVNSRRNGMDKAMAVSSFSCLVLSALLLYLKFVNILYPVLFGLALAGTLFYMRFQERGG